MGRGGAQPPLDLLGVARLPFPFFSFFFLNKFIYLFFNNFFFFSDGHVSLSYWFDVALM
jgi:hypothetical protein